MAKRTPFFELHGANNGKIVDFHGWEMPLNYGSQIDEHHKVRKDAGVFDVSHMTIWDIKGKDAKKFLRYLLANDVNKLVTPGHALYGAMLNPEGGVIDDLIVYHMSETFYRMVTNSTTCEKVTQWLENQVQTGGYEVEFTHRTDFGMLAVQGPKAVEKMASVFTQSQQNSIKDLKVFHGVEADGLFVARTGYTGEDGFEIMIPLEQCSAFFDAIVANDIAPCGLGARDTLRLEAGMNLYGNDMDETVSPLEAGMSWTVCLKDEGRDFIGKAAVLKLKSEGTKQKLVGLVLESKGVLRAQLKVEVPGSGEGATTSGTFSPTLKKGIALARVPKDIADSALVEMRGKKVEVRVVKPCFVRHGQSLID